MDQLDFNLLLKFLEVSMQCKCALTVRPPVAGFFASFLGCCAFLFLHTSFFALQEPSSLLRWSSN